MLEISILIKISTRMIFLMIIDNMDLNFKILHSYYTIQFPTLVYSYIILFKHLNKLVKSINIFV